MDAVQRAIREAKNAGWKPTERSVFLDPQFWRALGRARGWDECGFRRIRPGIPSEGGHRFRSKPAGDSDDPGHLGGGALVSACSSVQAVGWASRL
jgi:hypothetical protein